ncbi:LuxR C-terminal-related transcriptional regulator [Burkholderia sp. F1]|uniref:LuxR C-terminal-related transcriptional regulator n=1 Tax=Burkholderia sp. F1 TaxID=3366817 RepID=UPI003D73A597
MGKRMVRYAANVTTPAAATLSMRECEVLRWAAEGKTAYEIGIILGLTERTINFHISRSIAKLDASNKTNAVVKAVLMGLIVFA